MPSFEPETIPSGEIENWDRLHEVYRQFCVESTDDPFSDPKADLDESPNWIFRGMQSASWPLKTTLERVLADFEVPRENWAKYEQCLLHAFRRKAHKYSLRLPDQDDNLAWLALMRHYGAPTRLLDWTYSFFVAAHFAVSGVQDGVRNSAIYAIDGSWCARRYRQIMGISSMLPVLPDDPYMRSPDMYKMVFEREQPAVYPGNPFELNERHIVQQSFFLIPTDVSRCFEENLNAMLAGEPNYKKFYKKILISGKLHARRDILMQLHRMNITDATLFPGLEGFARSLGELVGFPRALYSPHAGKWR